MKRFSAMIGALAFSCGLLAGCGEQPEKLSVYSFCGENEQFALENGIIVLTEDKEVITGGDLRAKTEPAPAVSAYIKTIYLLVEQEPVPLLTSGVEDKTGGNVFLVKDSPAKLSGAGGSLTQNEEHLGNNLFLQLEITDPQGEQASYEIPLEVTEILTETE